MISANTLPHVTLHLCKPLHDVSCCVSLCLVAPLLFNPMILALMDFLSVGSLFLITLSGVGMLLFYAEQDIISFLPTRRLCFSNSFRGFVHRGCLNRRNQDTGSIEHVLLHCESLVGNVFWQNQVSIKNFKQVMQISVQNSMIFSRRNAATWPQKGCHKCVRIQGRRTT